MTASWVDTVAPADRAILAELWQARASSEAAVHVVFGHVRSALMSAHAHPEVLALVDRAIGDEARHAQVCADLAALYRGAEIAPVPSPSVRLAERGHGVRARAALHVANLCAIGETIATAFVEACHADCVVPELREIHGHHLADEIHHARIGWAHLASIAPEELGDVAAHLTELLRLQLTHWEERIGTLPEHGIPGHGYPPRATLVRVVRDAVRDLVIPGFAYIGVDVTEARAWFESHDGPRAR